MNRTFVMLFAIPLAILFSGCASITPMKPKITGPERYHVKNYTLAKVQSVFVGEEMVKYKDYKIMSEQTNKMKASSNFTFEGGYFGWSFNYSGTTNDEYTIAGIMDGCYVIELPGELNRYAGVLIGRSGYITGDLVSLLNKQKSPYTYYVSPKNTRFQVIEKQRITTTGGYTNFEIIYTGKDKGALNFLYREYTPDDLAKPAFYQNLTYDINSKIIRFKKYRIEILEVSEEKITYRVLEDGMKQ